MSNQPPYGYPPGGPQGYQGGGYPPPNAPTGKTKVMNLDYNVAGMLCYLPLCRIHLIFSIVWLASEPKENRLLRFHALQSLLLFAAFFVVSIIFWILTVAMAVTPMPGSAAGAAGWGLLGLLRLLVSLVFFVIFIIGC